MSAIWSRVRAGEILKDELIIDCHSHMGPWYNFHIAGDPWAAGLVAAMDGCGVDRIFAAPHVAIGPDSPLGNEFVAEAVRRFPNRISGYCTVNPNYPADETISELEKHVAHGNLSAIKLHPSLHGQAVTHPGYRPMWEWAQAHQVPVLSHTWDGDPHCAPDLFVRIGREYPDVPILLGHSGGSPAGMIRAVETAKEWRNLYLDLTGSALPYGVLEAMVAGIGADRILFGSDAPFVDIRPQIGYVAFARISDDEKRKIFGLNAKRLFKL